MLTSSENLSEKLILPGSWAGPASLLGVYGDKRWLSVGPWVARTGPQAPGEPASHSGQENGLCPGWSSEHFPVARTPEERG